MMVIVPAPPVAAKLDFFYPNPPGRRFKVNLFLVNTWDMMRRTVTSMNASKLRFEPPKFTIV